VAAARALRDAGSVRFAATYTRTRSDEPERPETYMTSEGAVDLTAERGWMRVSLASLLDAEEFEEPVGLVWDADQLVVELAGRERSMSRERARETGGLLGRLPDEPVGLVELLTTAGEPRGLGAGDAGARKNGYRLPVDLRVAGAAGVPAELSRAFAAGTGARSFALELWLDEDSLPRRLAYVVELDEVRARGRLILPDRTVRVEYELSAFGEPVARPVDP
jgi:hypothetical protein